MQVLASSAHNIESLISVTNRKSHLKASLIEVLKSLNTKLYSFTS